MEAQKSLEFLPYSEFRQGNYAMYNGKVVMISYHVGIDKFIVAINRTEIKEVCSAELSAIELNETVLKKCSPVTLKNNEYIFEFEYGTYIVRVSPLNNNVEVSKISNEDTTIKFSDIVYSLHTLQNIIMAFTGHPISYIESDNQNEE